MSRIPAAVMLAVTGSAGWELQASGFGRLAGGRHRVQSACSTRPLTEDRLPTIGIGAGLLGALSFGAGDFAGAIASRRAGALVAVAGAHLVGLLALVVAVLVVRPPVPDIGTIGIGLVAGLAGAAGLAALYRGMSLGSMGLVTSISGAGSLTLPLLAGVALGATVAPLQLAGVVSAAAAAAAAGGASRDEIGRRSLGLAGLAAVSFGAWYVLLDLAARGGDPLWALVFNRAASAGVAALVVAIRGFDRQAVPRRMIVAAGIFDVGGNALYVVAREQMALGLAAALIGLYPIVTMLLARYRLGEHLPRLGQLGVALAVLGIVLISAGG
jgi:drug/metabolite transporter (DMT)-like permease